MFAFLKSSPPAASPQPPDMPGAPYLDALAPAAPPPESRFRKWTRRLSRGFAIVTVVFILLVGWLALTAPLSKSLQPIAPPRSEEHTSELQSLMRISYAVF